MGKRERPSDDELAMQWRQVYPSTRYGAGYWRRYEAGHWPIVDIDQIELEIQGVIQANKDQGVWPTDTLVKGVRNMARRMIKVPDAKWDTHTDLVVMKNGTLDLNTMTLTPHNPEHYLTGGLDFDFDPEAKAPNWENALKRLGDDVVKFLQEYAGYSITSDTRHELAIWLYGLPGGGKSTFLEGLRAMLGGRVCNLNLGMIEKSQFALTTILGKTLAVSAEQPADFLKSTHTINSIISGETITVDRKYLDPVDVTSHVKICWAMNEFPRIPDAGNGIFRRVKVVTFKAIAGAEMDLGLKDKIRGEAAGVFNWALAGLARLNERGRFDVPQSVEIDTKSFQKNNDVAALFLDDKCVKSANAETKSSLLYSEYRQWCELNGHRPKSSTALAEELKRLGWSKVRKGEAVYWIGIGIKAQDLM